jgi:hypothetical protein
MATEINTKILPQNRQELIQSISDTWEQISVDCVPTTHSSVNAEETPNGHRW